MEKFELPIEDLLLDLENPRIGSVATQSEALAAIVEIDLSFFRNMMKSIRAHGLDPGDSFYLIDEGEDIDGYTVLDGNRRLAALMVLRDPTVLQGAELTSATVKLLLKEAEGFDPKSLSLVSCVLFDDRPSANEWILRRHGRGLDGEGRLAWGPLEIQRFQNDRTVLDVIEFVAKNSTYTEDAWSTLKSAVEGSSSALRRLLESKAGRDWLGFEVASADGGGKVPSFNREPKFVLDVLTHVFGDVSRGKVNTRSHNKASEIQEYFDTLPDELHPPIDGAPVKQLFRDAVVSNGEERPRQKAAAEKKKATSAQTAKPKPPRPTLSPARHRFALPAAEKGQQLLREAAILRLVDNPLAAAFVLRAFLQHTIDAYMTAESMPFWEGQKQLELSTRAERVLTHLTTNKRAEAKNLKGVRRTLTSPSDPASIQALNDYHHDLYQVPAADTLRSAWDSAEALFIAVHGKA